MKRARTRPRRKDGRHGPARVDRHAAADPEMLIHQAADLMKIGRLAEAEATYGYLVALEPTHVDAHYQLGDLLWQQGKPLAAAAMFEEVAALQPNHPTVQHRLGLALAATDRLTEAVVAFRKAIAGNPASAEACLELGNALKRLGRDKAAAAAFRDAIAISPNYAAAHYNLGVSLRAEGRLDEAMLSYRTAIACKPDLPEAHYNLGNILRALDRKDEAVASYRAAIAHRPNFAEAHYNLGNALWALGRLEEAVASYRQATVLKPDHAEAHNNLGVTLKSLGRLAEAVAALRKAIAIKPTYVAALDTLGYVLKSQRRLTEAEQLYRRALDLDPAHMNALEGLAGALMDQGKLEEAKGCLERILAVKPDDPEAFSGLCKIKEQTCDWRDRDAEFARLMEITNRQLAAGERTALTSFRALSRPLSEAQNLAIARSWANYTERQVDPLRSSAAFSFFRGRRDRLRIGYLSCDFFHHPTAHLIQGLFGLHDRDGFEVFVYSYGKDDGSSYRRRIAAECDHFVDLAAASLADGARRIHADAIDILVDLKGYTENHRLGILALRPAPVQVTYLGFPGTSGADFLDYVLTDPIVTPPASAPFYSEQFVYLPHCYQINDHTQPIAARTAGRAAFGLPEDGFVFCCFNNSYKLEPTIFDVWMRILARVPGSVLWLMRLHPPVETHLKRAAAARGLDPARLVFATKLAKPAHLARFGLADLFLDTRYYTAHTTASDALWAGVPVLTCPGASFAARVSASLLQAAGLPELIMPDLAAYERRAVELAGDPAALAALRARLAANRTRCPLFDTPRFVGNLERAYRLIWANFQAGHPPRQITVTED